MLDNMYLVQKKIVLKEQKTKIYIYMENNIINLDEAKEIPTKGDQKIV